MNSNIIHGRSVTSSFLIFVHNSPLSRLIYSFRCQCPHQWQSCSTCSGGSRGLVASATSTGPRSLRCVSLGLFHLYSMLLLLIYYLSRYQNLYNAGILQVILFTQELCILSHALESLWLDYISALYKFTAMFSQLQMF